MDTKLFNIFKEALTTNLRDFPYNSATQFYTYLQEKDVDYAYGKACVFQTFDVADRVKNTKGIGDAKFLQDGRHVAAVYELPEGIVVLDPYLLHLEPIFFPWNDSLQEIQVKTVPALPIRTNSLGEENSSFLKVAFSQKSKKDYTIILDYYRFSSTKNLHVLSRHFKLNSKQEFNLDNNPENINELLTHPEQNSLSIRVVSSSTPPKMNEVILPLHDWMNSEIELLPIHVRNNEGRVCSHDSEQAEESWNHIKESTGFDAEDIIDYLRGAAILYSKIANKNIAIKPYNLESE